MQNRTRNAYCPYEWIKWPAAVDVCSLVGAMENRGKPDKSGPLKHRFCCESSCRNEAPSFGGD
jgi:hypothetical protein